MAAREQAGVNRAKAAAKRAATKAKKTPPALEMKWQSAQRGAANAQKRASKAVAKQAVKRASSAGYTRGGAGNPNAKKDGLRKKVVPKRGR
jgi:hypothetical protein